MADGDLRAEHFPYWFDFTRAKPAPVRNAAGALIQAAANVPRFDHDIAGVALGLVVAPGEQLGTGDRATLQDGILAEQTQQCTVLHAYRLPSGRIERRAWFSHNARGTVNALAKQAVTHQIIAVMAGFLPNKARPGEPRFVRCRGKSWMLAGAIGAGDGVAIIDDADRPLIEQ